MDFEFEGLLERCQTLCLSGGVEKDLALLFSLHPHGPLNSTIFLYSRNIKENFIETPLNSFKDPSFGLTQIWGSVFPFLLFVA
jgi:hypothetical protein